MTEYQKYLESKRLINHSSGFEVIDHTLPQILFPFQREIVKWACKKGRAAIFADTGMGKGLMLLSWAEQVFQYTGNRVLIVAPLCVGLQLESEAKRIGVYARFVREFKKDGETGIYITNYEMISHFKESIDQGYFDGIVLDESSILKDHTSKTRKELTDLAQNIPYRLACTATPSPNDFMEIANHCEFLGLMTRQEMLSMFFIHDSGETQKWRLKGHAKNKFWEWMASWSVCFSKPSDLNFDQSGYDLPELNLTEHLVKSGKPNEGQLFALPAQTLGERISARRETVEVRVQRAVEIVKDSNEPWILWCQRNDEASQLAKLIPGSVNIQGSDSIEIKEKGIIGFTTGEIKILVTKPSIAGFGLNWQHCHNMIFVGLSDSFEEFYQAVRRCHRYGQTKRVNVHVIVSDLEGSILQNIKRKEAQHREMQFSMIEHMKRFTEVEIIQTKREEYPYMEDQIEKQNYTLLLGDCVERTSRLSDNSIDYSIFSPPFASLYTYSNSERDMGNTKSDQDFYNHFQFLIKELFRVLKPGRNISFHCMNLPTSKERDGFIGMRDFRGECIKLFQQAGFIYHSEVCIWKDPVVAMQRTKALGLLWKQIKKDSSLSRNGIPDYVVTMRKPGDNQNPISHTPEEFPVALWQKIASPIWMDIDQSDVISFREAREDDDEKHICPLQLGVIERCLMLWSKPGDLVLSPFMGIASEGYTAIRMKRRFMGIELKQSYFDQAVKNMELAVQDTQDLFSLANEVKK